MLFDTHMHCDYSCDSHMEFADAVAAAQAAQVGMIVTDRHRNWYADTYCSCG